jgi:hypothetical protein
MVVIRAGHAVTSPFPQDAESNKRSSEQYTKSGDPVQGGHEGLRPARYLSSFPLPGRTTSSSPAVCVPPSAFMEASGRGGYLTPPPPSQQDGAFRAYLASFISSSIASPMALPMRLNQIALPR